MGRNIKLMEKELTFEEFMELAKNIPKRPGKTIFCLEEIDIRDDIDKIQYPEFHIERDIMGLFESREMAEGGITSCISNADEESRNIYGFKIYELPLDRITNLRNFSCLKSIREYLYDSNGKELDHSICSSLEEDVFEEYGSYLGKPESELRFKKGDMEEIIGSETVSLGIVSMDPVGIRWYYDLYQRLRKDGIWSYSSDYSDDQVPVVDGPDYGNHSHVLFCNMMKPRFPVSEELRNNFKDYLTQSLIPR